MVFLWCLVYDMKRLVRRNLGGIFTWMANGMGQGLLIEVL